MRASYSLRNGCQWVKRLQHSSLSLWTLWASSGISQVVSGSKGRIFCTWLKWLVSCNEQTKNSYQHYRALHYKSHHPIQLAPWRMMPWRNWWYASSSFQWSKAWASSHASKHLSVITLNHGSSLCHLPCMQHW